ncbi:hypothetical protein POM88_050907 [Heracleum sosnowskyi]|uniref:C3H1-type domain-containing protein n=1 Tax=Heracleum sosnowskyi TaxID=360622 RepID=A0AAD8GZK7_9APIA|nr:hypothetical protein POM88_050907 [Heracleum sosnowskyi]
MGPRLSLWSDFITLPKAMQHPAANVIHLQPAFGPSTPLVNSLPLHGNPQILGQGPSPLKRCMYFSTPRGCWNGATCPYLHSKSDQVSLSRVEESSRCEETEARFGH